MTTMFPKDYKSACSTSKGHCMYHESYCKANEYAADSCSRYDDTGGVWALTIILGIIGVWWAGWTRYSLSHLHTRPGEDFPEESGSGCTLLAWSWSRFFRTMGEAYREGNLMRFFMAYFLFSDGYSTISSCGVIYAKVVLKMTISELVLILLLISTICIVGNYVCLYAQHYFGWTSLNMLLSFIAVYIVLSACGPLMDTQTIWLFALIHGFMIGAIQSYARVLFSQLVPVGNEAQFFTLYEITDKGSSWLGPSILAVLANMGYTRYVWWYITAVNLFSVPLLWRVDVEAGMVFSRQKLTDKSRGEASEPIPWKSPEKMFPNPKELDEVSW